MEFNLKEWGTPVVDPEDPNVLVYTQGEGTGHAKHLYVTMKGPNAGQAVERDTSNSVVARGTVPGFHTGATGSGTGGGNPGTDPGGDPKKDPKKPHVTNLDPDQTLPSSFSTEQLKGWGWVQDKKASSEDRAVWTKNGNTLDISSNGSAVYTNYQAGNGTGTTTATEHVRVTDPGNAGFSLQPLPTPAQQLASLEKGGEQTGIGGRKSSAGFGNDDKGTPTPPTHKEPPKGSPGSPGGGDVPPSSGGGQSTADVGRPKIKHFTEPQINNGSPAGTDASTSGSDGYQVQTYGSGEPIKSVRQLANGATLTTTDSGAVVETTAAGNSYRVKEADTPAFVNPSHHGEVDASSFGMPSAAGAEHTIGRADPSLGETSVPAANSVTTSNPDDSAQAAVDGYGLTTPSSTTSAPTTTQAEALPHGFAAAEAASEANTNPGLTGGNGGSIAAGSAAAPPSNETVAPTTAQAIAAASAGSNEPLNVTPNNLVTLPPVTNDTAPPVGLGGLSVDPSAHGSCFPAGSLVMTPKGEVPIESIVEGDEVNIWNLHQHKLGKSKVTKCLVHQNEPTIIIRTKLGEITTTPDHRFWTGHDWVPAGKLSEGRTLFDSQGFLREIKEIRPGETQTVYNLHVKSPEHNYLVEGLLVHNMKIAP